MQLRGSAAVLADALALDAAAGFTAEPRAHAAMLFGEITQYSAATSCVSLWGIGLGFVLLRPQDAFPG